MKGAKVADSKKTWRLKRHNSHPESDFSRTAGCVWYESMMACADVSLVCRWTGMSWMSSTAAPSPVCKNKKPNKVENWLPDRLDWTTEELISDRSRAMHSSSVLTHNWRVQGRAYRLTPHTICTCHSWSEVKKHCGWIVEASHCF